MKKRSPDEIPTNEPPRFYWELWRDPTQKHIPCFWEELISQAMILFLFLFLGIMGGLTLLWPADLAQRADVELTPSGMKPEWYSLGLFQLIKTIPEAIVLVGVVVLLLVVLPFGDRSLERNPRHKPAATARAA